MVLLDFVIQVGKFFSNGKGGFDWIDFFSKLFIGLLSAGIAYLLYVKKKNDDYKRDEDKKVKDNEKDLLYFETLFTDILSTIEKQLNYYENYRDSLKDKPYKIHSLSSVKIDNLNRILNKFEHNRLFHSYVYKHYDNVIIKGSYSEEQKKKLRLEVINNFMKIFNGFDYFILQYNFVVENTKKYHGFYKPKGKEYNNILDRVESRINLRINGNPNAAIVLELIEIKEKYKKLPLDDFKNSHDNYLNPILQKITNANKNNQSFSDDRMVKNACKDAMTIYSNIIALSNFYCNSMNEEIVKLNSTLFELRELRKK